MFGTVWKHAADTACCLDDLGGKDGGGTYPLNKAWLGRSFSCSTHTGLDTHTHQNDRPVHYSKLRGVFILEPRELLGST